MPETDHDTITEAEFEQVLAAALDVCADDAIEETLNIDGVSVARVSTFSDDGVLTRNHGLVVALSDGTEFQITIVQSR